MFWAYFQFQSGPHNSTCIYPETQVHSYLIDELLASRTAVVEIADIGTRSSPFHTWFQKYLFLEFSICILKMQYRFIFDKILTCFIFTKHFIESPLYCSHEILLSSEYELTSRTRMTKFMHLKMMAVCSVMRYGHLMSASTRQSNRKWVSV